MFFCCAFFFFFLSFKCTYIFYQVHFPKAAHAELMHTRAAQEHSSISPSGQSQQPDCNRTHPQLRDNVVPAQKMGLSQKASNRFVCQ